MNDITTEELRELMVANPGLNLIDVREEHEYDEDNIGGNLIPLGELQNRLEEIEHLRDEDVYVHCRSGKRSDMAKKIMIANGFQKVHNVLGGMLAYREMD